MDILYRRKSKAAKDAMPAPTVEPEPNPAPKADADPRAEHGDIAPATTDVATDVATEVATEVATRRADASTLYIEPTASTQQDVLDYLAGAPAGITFVHGKAGCGKTYLIRQIESANPACQVLTPTNLAASLYKRARTLHSFFWKGFDKLEEGFQNPDNIDSLKAASMGAELGGIDMLVFDEISMVRSDTFEMMDQICRKAMGRDLPFGGMSVVVVGDLFQLPPVVSDGAVYDYLIKEYGGIYFFDSHVVRDNIDSIRLFELAKSYRQKGDPEFVALLDAFRQPMSNKRKVEVLEALNRRVVTTLPDDAIYIASSNEEVSRINAERLDKLSGPLEEVEAKYKIRLRGSNKDYVEISHTDLPSDHDIEPIVLPSQYDGILSFKTGARVMLTKSCRRFGYNNGDIGTIEFFNGFSFRIRLDNGSTILCPNPKDPFFKSQIVEYRYEMEYDKARHKIVRKTPFLQRTTQFPIKPAYAFTIHKSQGQTYDKVILDLNSHIFAPGQLYVALSRAKSLDGLYLTKKIAYSDIISDDSIFDFLNELRLANAGRPSPSAASALAPAPSAPKSPGAPSAPKSPCAPQPPIENPRCEDFICFVKINEQNDSIRDFLCHTLDSYKSVFALGNSDLAMEELIKVIDLVNATYITDRYADMILSMRSKQPTPEDCRYNLNAIFEIYTDVVKEPRRQLTTDNKYLPT
ncbi:MAG: AAA family ATPase [Muribaculaceae bacterium]|nr:AAA family ATPase [Muribaculaceae bacterium]